MGLLVDGVWQDQWYDTSATKERFTTQSIMVFTSVDLPLPKLPTKKP